MASKATQRKYIILYSWVKWVPMLAVVFASLGVDAWLNIEKYNNDYLLWELGKEIKQLDDARQELRVRNVDIIDQSWVEEKVAAMKMVSLAPGQSRVITYWDDATPVQLTALPHVMARWDTESMAIANQESIPPVSVALVETLPDVPVPVPVQEQTETPSVLEQIKTVVEHIAPVVPEQIEAASEPELEAEPVIHDEAAEPELEVAAAVEPAAPLEIQVATPVEVLPADTTAPPVVAVLEPPLPAEPLESIEPVEPMEWIEPVEPAADELEILEPGQEGTTSIDDSVSSLISRM